MAGRIAYTGGIVRDGLVLLLDAAKRDSYPGSGTTWRDLSGNGNNGTLTNGPTFNSDNNGSIVFDGTNDYIDCGNSTNIQITVGTVSAWVKSSNPGSSYRSIIAKQLAWGLFTLNNILITYDWGSNTNRSTGINIADGNWKNVAMTFTETIGTPVDNANIYLNGSLVLTTTIKHNNNNISLQIAEANASQYLAGNVSNASIYNRALSATEIQQNFNALRGRYGI